MEQAYSGFLHNGTIVQDIRCSNGTWHKPVCLTWRFTINTFPRAILDEAGGRGIDLPARKVSWYEWPVVTRAVNHPQEGLAATSSERVITTRGAGNMSIQQTPAVGLCCSVCWGPDKLMVPKCPHRQSWPQYKCVHSFPVYARAAHSQGAARHIYHLRRERGAPLMSHQCSKAVLECVWFSQLSLRGPLCPCQP